MVVGSCKNNYRGRMHGRKEIECVSICQLDIEEDQVGLWIIFKPSHSFVHTAWYNGQCPLRAQTGNHGM